MLIRIDHATRYAYARPARFIIQTLRLTPRSDEGQQVRNWRIETDVDARLRRSEDAWGNIVHTLYTEAATDALTVRVAGDVATTDTGGVLKGSAERLSPLVYLRPTPLTQPSPALRALAAEAGDGDRLSQLHRLMVAVNRAITFDTGATDSGHTASEALALGRGVCQDHAHVFIACARLMGAPARYVSGHLARSDGQEAQEAAHAWAEAHVDNLGWVGFDAANGICPTDRHVRVASGPDYRAAAPIRGVSYGGGREALEVTLRVREMQQVRQQSQ